VALANVRLLGFEPVLGAHAREERDHLAGSDEQRAADVNVALRDPAIRGVFALRGGYGTMRILDRLDYAAFSADPKVVLGYSDLTAALNALTQRARAITFHGPVMNRPLSRASCERILSALGEGIPAQDLALASPCVSRGTARGPLRGGNLSLIAHLCGTPFAVETRGAIVFIEDVGEAPYRIDRMLTQLRLAGAFEAAAGVAVGDIGGNGVVRERLAGLGIPVAMGAPFGHIDDQAVMPIGVECELDADRGMLRFLESGVA
jgi:muramoyltetrapeptide carboxypeptidase